MTFRGYWHYNIRHSSYECILDLLKEKLEGLRDAGEIMLGTRGEAIVGEVDELEGLVKQREIDE